MADSPHTKCTEHTGISGRLSLIIALGLASIAFQGYAISLNIETRVAIASIIERVGSLESRVSRLERE